MEEVEERLLGVATNHSRPIDLLKAHLTQMEQHPAIVHRPEQPVSERVSCSSLDGTLRESSRDNVAQKKQKLSECFPLLSTIQLFKRQKNNVNSFTWFIFLMTCDYER